jgi:L-fuculose-phosphate aldolase
MRDVSEALRLLYERGLVQVKGGNVSVAEGGLVYITPSGVPRHRVGWMDVAVIDMDGRVVRGRPSSEWRMHLAIYRALEWARAVVHAHPRAVLSASTLGFKLHSELLEEARARLSCVAYVPWKKPGSWELAESAASTLRSTGCRAAVLERHGAVTVASDLWEALDAMEALEDLAWITLISSGRADAVAGG